MSGTYDILLGLALTVGITTLIYSIINQINNMENFEGQQAIINATNKALDNVQTEVTGMKSEIDTLKEQLGNMGLTAEQEAVIAEGLAGIRARAEAISTVDESAEPPVEPEA